MNDLREQFLERLTRALFTTDDGFVLKGGGAMRVLYGNERLTKDIDVDFSNPKRTAESLRRTVDTAIRAAARGLPLRDLRVHEPGRSEKVPAGRSISAIPTTHPSMSKSKSRGTPSARHPAGSCSGRSCHRRRKALRDSTSPSTTSQR